MKTNIREEVQKIVWDCKCQKDWSDTATKKIITLIQKRLLKLKWKDEYGEEVIFVKDLKSELSTKD